MQIPKETLDVFEQFITSLGAVVSKRSGSGGVVAVCVLGDDVLSVQDTPGIVYTVNSTNVQALAQITQQWNAILTSLTEEPTDDDMAS